MKITIGLVISVIAALIIGGALGIALFPTEKAVITEKIVQVPVDRVVEVPINVTSSIDYKQEVSEALLKEVTTDKSLRYCDDLKFDTSEISIKKVYEGFSLVEDSDGEQVISDVKIKLNYDDGKCYQTLVCGLDAEKELVC